MTGSQGEAGGLVRLLSDMESLRRFLRLYPAAHPALAPARERVEKALDGLDNQGETVIALAPDHFYWKKERVTLSPGQPAQRLIRVMFDLGIGAVRLSSGAGGRGVLALVEVLASLREPVGHKERDRVLGPGAEFSGVELIPLDLSSVQGVAAEASESDAGTRLVWGELAGRLGRDGAFALAGGVEEGDLTPGSVAAAAAASADPETLFDFLFSELAQEVKNQPAPRRPLLLREIRRFLSEMLGLLDPEHRALAVTVGVRHLPLVQAADHDDESLFGAEMVLDVVEVLLVRERTVPEVLQRAVYRMAAPASQQRPAVPEELITRARNLLPRLPLVRESPEEPAREPEEQEPTTPWDQLPWARDLRHHVEEVEVRSHLVRVLGEALALIPQEKLAAGLAVRLGEEFLAALEMGDFATAAKLAPQVASPRHASAMKGVFESGVATAVRCFSLYDRTHHPVLTALLTTLGTRALPFVLEQLATADSLAVRKRLLEVVLRQGGTAIPAVREVLTDQRWFVVRNAVFLLRRLGDREAAPLLKPLLADAQPQLVSEILKSLIAAGDPEWFPILMGEIDSVDDQRRAAALSVASRVRHPEIVRTLVGRLRATPVLRLRDPAVRELIQALGRLGDPAALRELMRLASAAGWRTLFTPRSVRVDAAAAIARLKGSAARLEAQRLAGGRDMEIARAVAGAVSSTDISEEDV